ncbi:MAG: hypothetical protein ACI9D5_002815 [Candidatus Endobugula sp.]|jgi:hypothetical protein
MKITNKGIYVRNNIVDKINLASRFGLGFLFIYHGLVPKILWLSKTEIRLVELSGIGIAPDVISPIVGVAEIVLGISIIIFKRRLYLTYIAGVALILLLSAVVYLSPKLLAEAFNPVSINIVGLVLCYIIIVSQTYNKNK